MGRGSIPFVNPCRGKGVIRPRRVAAVGTAIDACPTPRPSSAGDIPAVPGPATLTGRRRGRYGATEVQPKEERVNKSGLITEVAKRTGASKADVSRFLEATMGTIRENVAKGNRVALSGFGTFERKHRNKRVARNPRKPDVPIVVPARDIPSFNPGNEFREAIASKRRKSATKKR
jgi:DNA-binding protein HU-beta